MSRIAGSSRDVAMLGFRRQAAPVLSTLAACLIDALPIVAQAPLIPDFAFLTLIAWRLLRPEMWLAHMALPLGLFNDLVAGHPIGQSMALWTMFFIIFDIIDSRVLFRDYWMDWLIASVAITAYIFSDWYVGTLMGNEANFSVMLPQLGASILAFPVVARFVLSLDRWRLAR